MYRSKNRVGKKEKRKIDKTGRKFTQSTIIRIVGMVILLVLPINIMTIVLSNMVLEENKNQIQRELVNALDLNTKNLKSVLNNSSRRLIYQSMEGDSLGLAKQNKNQSKSIEGEFLSGVSLSMKQIQMDFPWIDMMYFHFPATEYVVCSGYPGINFQTCREYIRQEVEKTKKNQNRYQIIELEKSYFLFGSNLWNDAYFGTMINLNRLIHRLEFIQTQEGKILFFADKEGTPLTHEGIEFLQEQKITLDQVREKGEYGIFVSPVEGTDLQLVEVVDWNMITQNIPIIISTFRIVSILLTIFVIPVLLIYVHHLVVSPLNRLIRAIDKIEGGDLSYRIAEGDESREFEQINRNFNSMMDQVKNLKINVYEKELERKSIKMRYLNQQIQPHFILNAMNIIYCYEPEEYPLIQKLVLCISKYFRYIVKVDADFVLLSQEMDHIRNYFEIQKARYPDSFFAIVEYEEFLADALIPPLLLQNFAENAIKHSIKIGNKITIFAIADKIIKENKQMLRVRIADTGDGIEDGALYAIKQFQKTGLPQEGLGVGTQNTIERMKYLYGDLASIHLSRDETYSGTNVELLLPLHFAPKEIKGEKYADFANRR